MNAQGWGKFYAKTFTGSMYGAGLHVFTLMGFCVANAMPPEGDVEINTKMLAPVFGCPEEEILKALDYLTSPDPSSRTPGEQGRRLVKVGAFTYRLVNFMAYREGTDIEARKTYFREKQKEYRKRKKSDGRQAGATQAIREGMDQQVSPAKNSEMEPEPETRPPGVPEDGGEKSPGVTITRAYD